MSGYSVSLDGRSNRWNPFGKVVVKNMDSDEAGDYRIAIRWQVWFGRLPDFIMCEDIDPRDLDDGGH